MFFVLTLLTGYSYIEAVQLFGLASKTALESPELAAGMNPLDGIMVPTLGALYLTTTLLFPFVAIRALGQDKESGALQLSLQCLAPSSLVFIKLLAVLIAWGSCLVVALAAIAHWLIAGGHLALPEVVNLFCGHALYALVVTGIAFFAVSITESSATAAIVTLAFTLGFWVLDFASSTGGGFVASVGEYSPTQVLRQFERGLFHLPYVLALASFGLGAAAVAAQCIHPGGRKTDALRRGAGIVLCLFAIFIVSPHIRYYRDISEDSRNSFSPTDAEALSRMDKGLVINIHLTPEDSRARDYSFNVLSKLKRLVPGVTVQWADRIGLFAAANDERYGLIVYEYDGAVAESRSNSPGEILPLLYGLAGLKVEPSIVPHYGGYPLMADVQSAYVIFYGLLPFCALFSMYGFSRTGRSPKHLT